MAKEKESKLHEKKEKVAGKMKDDWAEKHGQTKGKQLIGTITGKKFGPKSY